MSNVKIIGISGATNGGKTTLSCKIVKNYPNSIVIKQDDFFREPDDPNHTWIVLKSGLKHQNWEIIGSVDWDKFTCKVDQSLNELSKSGGGFLIIEGHIIFNYQLFPFSFDAKFFLTLTKDECYLRRLKRNYIPADPPGYFEEIVWPMYLKNKAEIEMLFQDIIYFSGTDDPQSIYQKVIQRINNI